MIRVKLVNAKPKKLFSLALRYSRDSRAIHAAGELVRRNMVVPVDTGTLQAGIKTEKGRGYFRIISTAPYSIYVEYGTDDTRPKAFMRKAARGRKRKAAIELYKQKIRALRR